tara:strand:- start:4043 stop:5593 length:1551 start_codon:yes stop_codon:yes gene_type:complete
MAQRFRVVDLFAGPGGLAEGFSSVLDEAGERIFKIVLSVEKEASAHRTLTLRAFTRQFPPGQLPAAYYAFANGEIELDDLQSKYFDEWSAAEEEALILELGTDEGNAEIDRRLDELLEEGPGDDIVVIGGPPCQAYSLVGRSRNVGKADYVAEEDNRHFLYREYIRILDKLSPAAFVMENVKGILSSSVGGKRIFAQVRNDLEQAGRTGGGYRLIAMAPQTKQDVGNDNHFADRDFIIRAEEHGVPQARHRVIIAGLRNDLFEKAKIDLSTPLLRSRGTERTTVRDVLYGLPALRSGLSRGDAPDAWRDAALSAMEKVVAATRGETRRVAVEAQSTVLGRNSVAPRECSDLSSVEVENDDLRRFLTDPRLSCLTGHAARGHMAADLARYFFCTVFREAQGRPPKAADFPQAIAPDHQNWSSGKFADRFRVQGWDQPSTTVVSHIAKDGHYFIHPDPTQCRSLTVREAARLQTFPDNYIFRGNRTEQFVQVGNAVPPFLARQIGEVLSELLSTAEAR